MKDFRSEAAAYYPFATSQGHDHMAWAKRIMYREERKDSYLEPVQVQFAKLALGIEKPKEQK